MKLKPSQLKDFLINAIPARIPMLIVGAPGIGKTDVVTQATQAVGYNLVISHPVVDDPTDAKGMPFVHNGRADFHPFGELREVLESEGPTAWFLDDLGQAPPAVQASYMRPILSRRAGPHRIPDHVTFIAASNRRTDRAGVAGILEPVKSRFGAIVELIPDLNDWCQWAFTQSHIPPELIAFLRFRTDLLCDFQPTADLTNSPVPRTWSHVGKLLQLGLGKELESQVIAGAVGEGAASEFLTFLRMYRQLPSIDGILLNPDRGDIPEEPSVMYAVVTGLASKANPQNFGRISTYATRLMDSGNGEFAALLVRDCTERDKTIMQTPDFIRVASSPLGELISGSVN